MNIWFCIFPPKNINEIKKSTTTCYMAFRSIILYEMLYLKNTVHSLFLKKKRQKCSYYSTLQCHASFPLSLWCPLLVTSETGDTRHAFEQKIVKMKQIQHIFYKTAKVNYGKQQHALQVKWFWSHLHRYDNTAQIRLPSTSPDHILEKDEHNYYVL